jgi:protein phosphatase methylesterase 1
MSDLARSFAKAKLSQLPELPPTDEGEDDPDQDSSSASSMSSTGTVVPSPGHKPAPQRPVPWTDFFAQELYLEKQLDNGCSAKFHVYVTPPSSPKAPLLVLHHGAGSSAMSFALFAAELRRLLPEAGVLAVEAREHGSRVWDEHGAVVTDLGIEALSEDMLTMIYLTQGRLGWGELPRTLLVGHSLGGAVVTHAAKSGRLGTKVMGYAVLDVVEGSALDTIKQMSTYLASRPTSFESLERAIEWHVRSRTLRNPASARASVPPLLIETDAGRWVWRTDLKATEPFWENWFQGMSKKFLEARGAKLLLLAGTDRLDKELMIGQMQGKGLSF